MNYPLDLSFKLVSLGPQISVTGPAGELIYYIKMKPFKLKEEVTVFADAEQTRSLYTMKADRVIDFSASYRFSDQSGAPLGAVRRKGMRSLWQAHYNIFNGGAPEMTIQEESVAVRLADGCLNQIPIVGLFAGYFFHPSYLVTRSDGAAVMRLRKMPAFFEGKFQIEKLAAMGESEETRVLLSLLMMVLLERTRG